MDKSLYVAMTGARASLQAQATVSQNLANANTAGFKEVLANTSPFPVTGPGWNSRVDTIYHDNGFNARAGSQQVTGNAMDVSLAAGHWLAVQGPDGSEAYTRNGALEVTAEGQLVTANGLAVLSEAGAPIDVPQNARISFGGDGTVVATLDGQDPINIGRLKLVTPNAEQPLQRGDDGLFRSAQGDLPADANATVVAGALEGSNVNAVEAMVGMIAASRQFEQQMKLLTTAENNDKTASQLLSLNG